MKIFLCALALSVAAPDPRPARVSADTIPAQRARPVTTLVGLFTYDDYPDEAIKNEEQGMAAVRLDVDPDGMVSSCSVTMSSTSASLDAATCSILKERARFIPARDAKGQPTADRTYTRVRWLLPTDGPESVEDVSLRQIYAIDADRKIAQCSRAFASAPPKLVECGSVRGPFQAMIDAAPPSFELAGRQLIFEIAEFLGEQPVLRTIGAGLGDHLLGRDQVRLTIDHNGMVIDCELQETVGQGNAGRGDAVCAKERKRRFEPLDPEISNRSTRFLTKITALYLHSV